MSDKPNVVAWHTEDHLTDKSATTYIREVADRWLAKGWPVKEMLLLSDHEAVVAPLLNRARTAERESMIHMKTLRGLERVSMAVADHSDEVNVENNLLRQERAADKARIEDLENLLKAHYSTQFSIK